MYIIPYAYTQHRKTNLNYYRYNDNKLAIRVNCAHCVLFFNSQIII